MRTMLSVGIVLVSLAGCSAAPPTDAAPSTNIAAGVRQDCIALNRVAGRRTVPPAAVEFELVGGRILRNQLASACPGLDRNENFTSIAITSTSGGGLLCKGDRIRVFDPAGAKATGLQSYPECLLGTFVEVPRS